FTDEDHRLVRAAADVGAELLRHALAQRQTRQGLFGAVAAALGASDSGAQSLRGSPAQRPGPPAPLAVPDPRREGPTAPPAAAAEGAGGGGPGGVVARRAGPPAVKRRPRVVEDLRARLGRATGG